MGGLRFRSQDICRRNDDGLKFNLNGSKYAILQETIVGPKIIVVRTNHNDNVNITEIQLSPSDSPD